MICGKIEDSQAHRRLLKYVQTNNERGIERLVVSTGHENLLNDEYSNVYKNHTILIIACNDDHHMENVSKSTISRLIKLGANCTQPTRQDHWEAIHYAAINANFEKLSAIVDHLTKEEINSLVFCSKHIPKQYFFASDFAKTYSNNALSILLKYGNREKNFKECCKLLIEKGINVYQADSNGVTPFDLMKQEPELSGFGAKIHQEITTGETIFDLIKFDNEKDFLSVQLREEEANDTDGPTEKSSSCTLLQLCCAKGLTCSVKHLLESGANPNKTIPKNTKSPIMIAIKKDHEDIVKLLLQSPYIVLPEDILIKLQIKYEDKRNFVKIDKYMELILKRLEKSDKTKLRNYLICMDDINRTGLHYAVHYRSSENILQLLTMGAPLTRKDIFGFTPMHTIEPNLLEKFFDSCVNITKEAEGIDTVLYELQNQRKKFSVEINYEALMAGSKEGEIHESEFLRHLIGLKKLTSLLNHPVISSYLEVKWQKFKWAVYINLLLYLMAYISLLFYGFAYNTLTDVSNIFLLVSLVLIGVRELVQLMLYRMDYLKRVDNLIDLVLIGGIIYIISSGWVHINSYNMRVAFSIVFLTSTLGIFLQLGNLPFFTVKVIVLRQISISFFKYMIFYVFPLLAFFFCFYMLQESSDDTFFQTLYDVITMFAGDPDSAYPEQFEANPIFSHIIYVCFIVLIGIILQNLLIGLAVNDLQEIEKEAEFIDKKERANYITNMERVLFSKLEDSSHWLFKSLFRKLLHMGNVFRNEYVLVIQPYNNGCVYVKENPNIKRYIKDQSIIHLLQNIFKDLALAKDKDLGTPYSLKVIYEKLERIENMLAKFNLNELYPPSTA